MNGSQISEATLIMDITFCNLIERVASIIASGEVPEGDEPNEKFIIPPDMMMGRRMSCF